MDYDRLGQVRLRSVRLLSWIGVDYDIGCLAAQGYVR